MAVLEEILSWSKDRPAWQRDALRRLVEKGELTEEDLLDLTEVCKSTYGLTGPRESEALAARHLPGTDAAHGAVALDSIFHHRGVNALAEDQTLKFGPRFTIVYGDNGAGKTGYIRILKSACRARGRELILGNVVSGATPHKPVVAIRYWVGTEPDPREWAGEGEDDSIARVSVFDTQSASVYLTEKTDVAFRPFGLDLFDKLVQACKAVRVRLESERGALGASAIAPLALQVPEGTAVAKLLKNLTSLTKTEAVKALATLSEEEKARLALLEKSLLDLQANDPAKLVQQLKLRASRVRALSQHLGRVEAALSDQAVAAAFDARAEWRRKTEEASRLRAVTFPAELLAGTGSDAWKALWQAARSFSQDQAYPGQAYPVVENGAQCVLCQQGLDHDAAHRLKQFETFVFSTTERELREALSKFDQQRKVFAELTGRTEATEEAIKEIRIEHEAVADAIDAALSANEDRRKAVSAALAADADMTPDCPAPVTVQGEIAALADQLEERVRTLSGDTSADKKKQLTTEAHELSARSNSLPKRMNSAPGCFWPSTSRWS